jgi:hypothetical protein
LTGRSAGAGCGRRFLNYEEHPEDWDRCSELADGSSGFVALDLAVAFHKPDHFARYLAPESAGVVL